jgi:protein required for attachment to host cells
MNNWIIVANAARARVLREADSQGGRRPSYETVADLVHPESRQKGVDLGDDRAGHVEGQGHGLGSAAYQPRTDPREREHDRFAQQIARFVDEGIAAGRCAGVVLVAGSPFLGRVKAHLGEQARKAVLRTVVADYTSLDEKTLLERLAPHP